jgi:hypothetical protein
VPGFRFSALKGLLEAIEANFKDIKVNGGTFDEVTVNGTVNATDGVFTGTVHAENGSFKNGMFTGITANGMTIDGNSTLKGNIDNDVLVVKPSNNKTFNSSGYNVDGFWDYVRAQMNYSSTITEFAFIPESSTGWQMQKIVFDTYYAPGTRKRITITTAAGGTVKYETGQTLPAFSFTIGTAGRTIKLTVNEKTPANSGEVYKEDDRQGNYFLKIKK